MPRYSGCGKALAGGPHVKRRKVDRPGANGMDHVRNRSCDYETRCLNMFRPTKATLSVFIVLLTVTIGPMLVFDSPSTQVIPFCAMYWLDLVADAGGLPVAVNGGVDAFKLAPANLLGSILIIVGSVVSLIMHYVAACMAVAILEWD
jgi:hypothetical protein